MSEVRDPCALARGQGESDEELLGGVSTLDPAVILYGFEPGRFGICYTLVDNKGRMDIGPAVDQHLNHLWWPCVAYSRAVQPPVSRAFTLAPAASSTRTMFTWPATAAAIRDALLPW